MKLFFVFTFIFMTQADDRIKLVAYTESLCSSCIDWINNSLTAAYNTPDFDKIIDLQIVSFGNGSMSKNTDGTYSFKCDHGYVECYGNMVESCALKQLNGYYRI